MPRFLPWCRAALILGLLAGALPARAQAVTVFAAASLKTALEEVTAGWTGMSGVPVRLSFAASSALSRQIARGAPADIFISANAAWMDHLEELGAIDLASRRDLFGNRLALVGQVGAAPVDLTRPAALVAQLGDGRLAMGLVNAVPVGIYGKAALQHLGLWAGLQGRVVETDNARAALALVSLGAAPMGVVYATDARAEPRVAVLAVFPEDSHPRIVYPAAVTSGAAPPARALLAYLSGPDAAAVFQAHGFRLPD